MALKEINPDQFQAFLDTVPTASFMQSLAMADLLSKRGMTVAFVGLEIEGKLQVASMVYSLPMTGGLHMEVNCGPIHSNEQYLPLFYKELKAYAKEKQVLELLVKPYDTYQNYDSDGQPISEAKDYLIHDLVNLGYSHDGLQIGYPGGEPDWHYVKDLSGLTSQNLLSSFSKKGKPLVKKANTFGIQLRKLEKEELSLFKAITEATSDRREYADKSLDYYQDFYDAFGEQAEFMVASLNFEDYLAHLEADQAKLAEKIAELESALIDNPKANKKANQVRELTSQFQSFEVRKREAKELIEKHGTGDIILAGSLFLYTDKEATYLFSGSYPEFNKFYAPALLQEYVMKEAIERGLTFYNFLGIMGVFDGSDGVLGFKKNFNGYITRKMGTFRYYPNPLKFKALALLKKTARQIKKNS